MNPVNLEKIEVGCRSSNLEKIVQRQRVRWRVSNLEKETNQKAPLPYPHF
jgi:hypothetical protein